MLQGIRDRAHGWLAWVIVLLISIPFALWGIQEYFGADPNVPIAEVNGTELGLRQFQEAYQQQRQRLQSLFGEQIDINRLDEDSLRKETLKRLIEEELILQAGVNNGLHIGDEQLARAVRTQQIFQRNGAFAQELYEQRLRSLGYTPGGYESELRRSLLVNQMHFAIAWAEIVTPHDVNEALRLRQQTRKYVELVLPMEQYRDIEISDESISDYYAKHQARFVKPEQINVAYLELSRDVVAGAIQVDENELRRLYESQESNYVVPEQRRASHILVQLAEDADETTVAMARKRLDDLRHKLDEGMSFEVLAKKHSEDSGSRNEGGDLGFLGRGEMDKRFEEAVYSMDVGQVSEPIRTDFGLHLIQLTDIRPPKTKSFDEVRGDILRDYQHREAEQLFFEQAEQLANLTFEYPDTLTVAAETLGLEVKETGFFGRNGQQDDSILGERKVIDAAFSEEVLQAGNNSEPIELTGNRIVVVRLKEHRPATPQSLDAARDEIRGILKADAARTKIKAHGQKLVDRLRQGEDPETVASGEDRRWTKMKEASRGDPSSVGSLVLDNVFKMPRPTGETPTYDGIVNEAGDYVIIALKSVVDGHPGNADAKLRVAAKDILQRDHGREAYDGTVRSLRNDAEIIIHQANL